MEQKTTCPNCSGRGCINVIVNFATTIVNINVLCIACGGKGYVIEKCEEVVKNTTNPKTIFLN